MSEPAWDSSAAARIGAAIESARAEEKRHRDAAIVRQVEWEETVADLLSSRPSQA